ncbi:MAG: DUF2179 domain-containing protein [Candidatus Marinimicrobia bacterium]|nr:DUF2179 domain-containing protein [Candidatus Neomarinimicrobiota bacterium]
MESQFLNSTLFTWVIMPILIFCARIMDVSIGTIRIIFVSKGSKVLASILGFFEVSIWLIAISEVMKHISNPACFFAYGLGFGSGNFIGITLEEKMALGLQAVRIVTHDTIDVLTMALRDAGYGATVMKANGAKGEVNIILSIVPRKKVHEVLDLARGIDPDVFVSIQDIRSVNSGWIPGRNSFSRWKFWSKNK